MALLIIEALILGRTRHLHPNRRKALHGRHAPGGAAGHPMDPRRRGGGPAGHLHVHRHRHEGAPEVDIAARHVQVGRLQHPRPRCVSTWAHLLGERQRKDHAQHRQEKPQTPGTGFASIHDHFRSSSKHVWTSVYSSLHTGDMRQMRVLKLGGDGDHV